MGAEGSFCEWCEFIEKKTFQSLFQLSIFLRLELALAKCETAAGMLFVGVYSPLFLPTSP